MALPNWTYPGGDQIPPGNRVGPATPQLNTMSAGQYLRARFPGAAGAIDGTESALGSVASKLRGAFSDPVTAGRTLGRAARSSLAYAPAVGAAVDHSGEGMFNDPNVSFTDKAGLALRKVGNWGLPGAGAVAGAPGGLVGSGVGAAAGYALNKGLQAGVDKLSTSLGFKPWKEAAADYGYDENGDKLVDPHAAAKAADAKIMAGTTPVSPAGTIDPARIADAKVMSGNTPMSPPGTIKLPSQTPGLPQQPNQSINGVPIRYDGKLVDGNMTGLQRQDGGTDYIAKTVDPKTGAVSYSGSGNAQDSSAGRAGAKMLDGANVVFGNGTPGAAPGGQQDVTNRLMSAITDMQSPGRHTPAQAQALEALTQLAGHQLQYGASMQGTAAQIAMKKQELGQQRHKDNNDNYDNSIAKGFVDKDGKHDDAGESAFHQLANNTLAKLGQAGDIRDASPEYQQMLRNLYTAHQAIQQSGGLHPGSHVDTNDMSYLLNAKQLGNQYHFYDPNGNEVANLDKDVAGLSDPTLATQWLARMGVPTPWNRGSNTFKNAIGAN